MVATQLSHSGHTPSSGDGHMSPKQNKNTGKDENNSYVSRFVRQVVFYIFCTQHRKVNTLYYIHFLVN